MTDDVRVMSNGDEQNERQLRSSGSFVRLPHWTLLVFLLGAFVQSVHACSIPVFRYALDRWQADTYRLEVSATDAKDEAVARFLRNLGTSSPYNIEGIRLSPDVSGPSRLLFPAGKDGQRAEVWSGMLNAETLERFIKSPVRQRVVEQIVGGASAVWVFVESGDKEADDVAVTKLEKRLRYLENVAQLPRIDPTDPTSKLGPGPELQVKFSTLRVAKTEAVESFFLRTLAGSKATEDLTKGAWLAAVFGRGRVLGSWPVAGFGDEQVEEVCLFLLGACSCQVKNLNPGWDLLLSADWESELEKADKLAVAAGSTTGIQPEKTPEPETVRIEGKQTVSPDSSATTGGKTVDNREHGGSTNWAMVAGLVVLIVAGICFWFGGQARR